MVRFRALAIFTVLAAACGCDGGGASSSSSSNIVINVSPAKADVDAGGTFVLNSTITGDPKNGVLSTSISGVGTISTTGPDFSGGYSTLYTAPGSPTGVNPTSIAGTTANITVASKTDGSRNIVVPVSLHDNIQFPAQTPSGAFAGKAYSYTFTASGGTGTLNFALLSTSTPLPTGLTLSSAGVLSGRPAAVGTYSFQIIVTDQATKVVGIARTFTLQVS